MKHSFGCFIGKRTRKSDRRDSRFYPFELRKYKLSTSPDPRPRLDSSTRTTKAITNPRTKSVARTTSKPEPESFSLLLLFVNFAFL